MLDKCETCKRPLRKNGDPCRFCMIKNGEMTRAEYKEEMRKRYYDALIRWAKTK